MRTFYLDVTAEEAAYLANNLPAGARWPEPWDSYVLGKLPGGEPAGGIEFRLKIVALRTFMARTFTDRTPLEATLQLEVTEAELWFLDYMLNCVDYSKAGMGAGTPVFTFVKKVWDCLLTANADALDPRYLPASQAQKVGLTSDQKQFLDSVDKIVSEA